MWPLTCNTDLSCQTFVGLSTQWSDPRSNQSHSAGPGCTSSGCLKKELNWVANCVGRCLLTQTSQTDLGVKHFFKLNLVLMKTVCKQLSGAFKSKFFLPYVLFFNSLWCCSATAAGIESTVAFIEYFHNDANTSFVGKEISQHFGSINVIS